MATGFASALSEGQPAQLDLGDEAVPCLVVGFTGADVVLAPSAELPEDALSPGLTHVSADRRRRHPCRRSRRRSAGPAPTASSSPRCWTRSDSGSAARSRARRSSCPLTCARSATRSPPKTTFTRDISAGGLRVARQSSYQPADVHNVVIGLVQAGREIKATAETVRETDQDVSLSFIDIETEDRLILAQLTFAYHRRRAGQ